MQVDVIYQQSIIDAPECSLKQSTRERIPSFRYSLIEYVILIEDRELESLDKVMKTEEKEK